MNYLKLVWSDLKNIGGGIIQVCVLGMMLFLCVWPIVFSFNERSFYPMFFYLIPIITIWVISLYKRVNKNA